jgi:hypothetical protein
MWNIKKADESSSSGQPQPSFLMNPYEVTKQELVRKLKFFGIYVASIVVVPRLLRSIGLLEPLGVPLTRR